MGYSLRYGLQSKNVYIIGQNIQRWFYPWYNLRKCLINVWATNEKRCQEFEKIKLLRIVKIDYRNNSSSQFSTSCKLFE
jgi:hypothetical protein